ncbi:MAG: hypothetical protein ACAI44_30995 [Candidatus Sericytochromatia bacterium]
MARSQLILSAGMGRAGSTWLFNAARLLLCSSPTIAQQLSFGWVGDLPKIPLRRYMLLKIHDYHPQLVAQSSTILYSYRDIRDVIASMARKFGRTPQLGDADHLVAQFRLWMPVAQFVMRYEDMLSDKQSIIAGMAAALGRNGVDPAAILAELEAMSFASPGEKGASYHVTNLYHPGHITDGRHGSWRDVLDPALAQAILARHRDWFEANGYETEG